MHREQCGRSAVAPLFLFALALGASAPAEAQQWLPDLTYATDAELGPIKRTGLIAAPDFKFANIDLSGTGGALLKDPDGFTIGAKLGYDWQIGNFVVGVVTDGYYSFADGGGRGAGAGRFASELNYYGTVRGKLGVSLGRWMPYATAGYAYGGLEVKDRTLGLSDSTTLSGWAYGGGLEFVWNKDITLHAGYRRLDFGEANFSSLPTGQNNLSAQMDVFDFGLVIRY